MAGDWIKMRHDLADDPAVVEICEATGLDEFGVIGRLYRFWSWADRQTTDGNASRATRAWLDRYVRADGFAEAMVNTGWLVAEGRGLVIPNFERHNGETAKQRGLTAKRVDKYRHAKRNATRNGTCAPEQNRTEKRICSDKEISNRSVQSGSNQIAGAAPATTDRADQKDAVRGDGGPGTPGCDSGPPGGGTIEFTVDALAGLTSQIFGRVGYEGKDGAIFWLAAALYEAGRITESELASASRAAKTAAKNRPAYFRTVLAELLAKRSIDLDRELKRVLIKPRCPKGLPE